MKKPPLSAKERVVPIEQTGTPANKKEESAPKVIDTTITE